MKRAILVALATGTVISSAAAIGIGATTGSDEPQNLTRAQYESALRGVESARQAVVIACDAYEGNDRDICRVEAAGAQMVRVAELGVHYRRTAQAARLLQRARIDARYQLERVRCGALNGLRRDRCLVQAHATKGRALLEAAAPYEVRF